MKGDRDVNPGEGRGEIRMRNHFGTGFVGDIQDDHIPSAQIRKIGPVAGNDRGKRTSVPFLPNRRRKEYYLRGCNTLAL
jgi:hypothetical protein